MARGAFEGGVWTEVAGARTAIEVALRPRLMDLAGRGYVHHAAWQIRTALRRVVRLAALDPRVAAVLPLADDEADWLARYRRLDPSYGSARSERIFCRLDALGRLDGPGWREGLRFIEVNVVGIGGMSYSPPAEQALMEAVIPALAELDPDLEFDSNHDPRWLLLDELHHQARAVGVRGTPTVALVDDRTLYTLGGELGRLLDFFTAHGVPAVYCDPRELEVGRDGALVAAGRPVDVIYRFLELRDLVAMEAGGARLDALRVAFARNCVVPSVGGDLEHKSVLELLSDPLWADAFEPETRQVMAEHVLWTRLLRERRTTAPDRTEIDLVPWVDRNRERLVIKPNRACGGEGVVIGRVVDAGVWRDALQVALSTPDTHVVQEAAATDVEPFPVLDADGGCELVPMCCAVGLFPGRRGLGVFGRYAPGPVVNIQAGGGIAPFLVGVR
ncbi:MAG: hypothetical protein H6983_03060 [Ectothiorhodospiraceae bacterium]|nr:hypothetical protein [Ectothiorhodospiraceae bacterium]